MKLTRKLIEALITEEERVVFKTTYKEQDCNVLIGGQYFVVEFADGTMLQQNQEDIERGDCFTNDSIEVYTSLKKICVEGTLFFSFVGELETK